MRTIRKTFAGREAAFAERRTRALVAALAVGLLVIAPQRIAVAQEARPVAGANDQNPPVVPQPKPYVMPEPAVRTLANGLRIVVIERHSLPDVTLRLVVKAGAEADPGDAPGIAQLVTALLNQGTTRRSALEIAEAIDRAGGEIDTGAEWDDSYAALGVLGDQTDLAFDLLADMILDPAFAPAEVERKRRQILSALEVAQQDPGYVADRAFDHLALGGTPYGHPQDGTLESLARLTPDDLRAFHSRYYRPDNSILAVVGDISADEAFRLAAKYFGDWKGKAPVEVRPQRNAPSGQRAIIVIDKPDAVQTEIRVGNYGIRRDSPDYHALTVANQILGGPAANRLFSALRTRRGLAYGASSDLNSYQTAGTWAAKTSTRTLETSKALKVILDQMQTFRRYSAGPSELEVAKGYLVGHLALEFESSPSVAAHVVDLMVHNLPLDYWNRFPERVRALSAQDVTDAVRRHLDPDHAAIVLVGDAGEFKKGLKQFGPARIIPLANIDFGSINLERPSGAAGKP